jgi:hypothetical protein
MVEILYDDFEELNHNDERKLQFFCRFVDETNSPNMWIDKENYTKVEDNGQNAIYIQNHK